MRQEPLHSDTPRPQNHKALILTVLLLGVAFSCFVASFFLPAYGGVLQMLALLLVVVGLFIASRFLMVEYTYLLAPGQDGRIFFLVEQKQGRRSSLVCHLPLSRLLSVTDFSAANSREKYYTYVATMGGSHYQLVSVRSDKGTVGIKIEASDAFVTALRDAIAAQGTDAPEEKAEDAEGEK